MSRIQTKENQCLSWTCCRGSIQVTAVIHWFAECLRNCSSKKYLSCPNCRCLLISRINCESNYSQWVNINNINLITMDSYILLICWCISCLSKFILKTIRHSKVPFWHFNMSTGGDGPLPALAASSVWLAHFFGERAPYSAPLIPCNSHAVFRS